MKIIYDAGNIIKVAVDLGVDRCKKFAAFPFAISVLAWNGLQTVWLHSGATSAGKPEKTESVKKFQIFSSMFEDMNSYIQVINTENITIKSRIIKTI